MIQTISSTVTTTYEELSVTMMAPSNQTTEINCDH